MPIDYAVLSMRLSSWCGVSILRIRFRWFWCLFLHKFPLLFYHRKGLSYVYRHYWPTELIMSHHLLRVVMIVEVGVGMGKNISKCVWRR